MEDTTGCNNAATPPIVTLGPIIKTSLNGSKLELNEIVLKETYVLRNLKIINTVDYPVQIKLKSDLPQMLAFQAYNENMQDNSDENPVQDDDANQLFNEVNLIDNLVLAPKEIKNVILSFRPNSILQKNKEIKDKEKEIKDKEKEKEMKEKEKEKESIKEDDSNVNGGLNQPTLESIRTSGESSISTNNNNTIVTDNSSSKSLNSSTTDKIKKDEKDNMDSDSDSSDEEVDVKSHRQDEKFNYFEIKGKIYLTVKPLLESIELHPSQKELTIDLVARICKSLLKMDINELIFDDCIVNSQGYVKDITLWNKCEMPVRFSIYCKENVMNYFTFTDHSSGQPLSFNDNQIIQSYSSIVIRVNYKPTNIGQFTYKFKIENNNDSNNFEYLIIHSSVTAEQQQELLQVTSNNSIEFGDCYTDVPTFQTFTIKNISEESIDVNFSSDLLDEVTFHIHEDDHDLKKSMSIGSDLNRIGSNNSLSSTSMLNNIDEIDDISTTTPLPLNVSTNEQIEELTINPGSERVIQIRYCPKALFPLIDSKSQRLTPKNFRILLKYGKLVKTTTKQKNKTIKVSSRVCTSVVKIPKEINLGDCSVGSNKAHTIPLHNLSDLPATIQLRYQSKVVAFKTHNLIIPPKQVYELQMDFLPRKNNPDYRKQITFINLKNPLNDQQFLEVRANNLDEHSVAVHSRYYHLETPHARNLIDFDETIVNCPSVRTFTIKNTSKGTLTLGINTSLPDEIKIYKEQHLKPTSQFIGSNSSTPSNQSYSKQNLQEYISKFFEGEEIEPLNSKNLRTGKDINSQYLDLALPKLKSNPLSLSSNSNPIAVQLNSNSASNIPTNTSTPKSNQTNTTTTTTTKNTSIPPSTSNSRTNSRAGSPILMDTSKDSITSSEASEDIENSGRDGDHSTMILEELEKHRILEATQSLHQWAQSFEDNDLPLFTDFESENKYITSQIEKYKKLDLYIQSGQLNTTHTIELAKHSEITLYVVCNVADSKRPWLGHKLKNMEAKLFVSLIRLDQTDLSDSPVRELPITTKTCKSIMDLAQRNINFGAIVQYDYRTKSLVINNLSQVTLIYRIKKSGSVASGNLNIVNTDRMGIVRPYRKREVQFVFKPTFSGTFDEKLVIENIYDSANNQVVHIKANVKKPRHFFLNTLDIDFGLVMVKGKSMTKRITLTNTSNQKRIFKIIDDSPSPFETCLNKLYFKLEEKSAFSISKETEVEIDLLERKLKICRRKGQQEKALKINMQIEKLRNMGSITPPNQISRATSPTQLVDDNLNNNNNNIINEDEILIEKLNDEQENNQKPQQFCKVGDNSITFEIEGGGIQNVLVYFSPIPKPGKRQWLGKEEGTGSILVYESKNIDITKKINYTATIAFDEVTFKQNITTTNTDITTLSNNNGPHTKLNFNSNLKSSNVTLFKPIAVKQPQQIILTLNPNKIDLGEVRVYEDLPFRFLIVNHIGHRVNYDILIKQPSKYPTSGENPINVKNALTIKEKSGTIDPYGKKSIEVICQPQLPGKQTHTIVVTSNSHSSIEYSLPVTLSPRPPQYVLFPDLPTDGVLSFGNCYYDKSKRFSKTLSFRLDNLSHKSLFISMKSNLTMQVFVFQDEKLTKPAENLFLKGYEKSVVYICLKPSMTSENYVDGHCRELVGGIRIKVHDSDHNMLYENMIKFISIIGKSILKVPKNLIDLGSTRKLGDTISSSLSIMNQTTLLPLQYSISHSKNLKLSKIEGILEGSEVNHSQSKEKIQFSLSTSIYGLYEEKIIITNKSCSGQKIEVLIRLLVDDASLHTNLPINSDSSDFLRFDDIYVIPTIVNGGVSMDSKSISFKISSIQNPLLASNSNSNPNKTTDSNSLEKNDKPLESSDDSTTTIIDDSSKQLYQLNQFTIKNFLKNDIRVYPKSNINVYMFLHEPNNEEIDSIMKSISNDRRKQMRLCGKPFVLSSEQKVNIFPYPPEPDCILTQKQKQMLTKGRKVKFQGTMEFERSNSTHYPIAPGEGKTHICKLVDISGSFCMSIGEILDKSPIDIGRIGYENLWKEVFITCEIKNLSEIPMFIKISKLPSKSIRLLFNQPKTQNPNNNNVKPNIIVSPSSSSNRIPESNNQLAQDPIEFQIPPLETKQVVIAIDPSKIEQSGLHSFPIEFLNIHNPSNLMVKQINLFQTLKVLNFTRLTESENVNSFNLSPIYHPPLLQTKDSNPSDEWFTIENISNKSLKIQTEVELLTEFQEILTVELLHKTSNTPLPSFSLRPSEQIEVKIRVKPRADSRLKGKYEETVSFGKILINTNQYPVESIPLKGTLLPGPTFSLAPNRINFNLMTRLSNQESTEQSLQSSLTDHFKIKNTSTHFPLRFKVEEPINQSSSLLPTGGKWITFHPEEGEIPPNEAMNIEVSINIPTNNEDIPPALNHTLLITSVDSISNESQKVSINIIGNYKPTSPTTPNTSTSNVNTGSITTSTTPNTGSSTPLISNSSSSSNTNLKTELPLTPSMLSINNNQTILNSSQSLTNTPTPIKPILKEPKESKDQPLEVTTSTPQIIDNSLPKLSLKGCTPISKIKNCYEIHLSQQEFSSGSLPWDLTLSNLHSSKNVEYAVYSMKDSDENWLSISRNSGKIEPYGRHIISLSFSTKKIEMYSTYIIIENKNNPADTKTIQITLDVVVKQNSHFSVLVEGKQNPSPVINLGDVYYGTTYTDRSFIVSNSSSMPLDFMVSTNLLPTDPFEVCFSLSRSYLRQFNTLYVEPNSQVKVFIYFHASYPNISDIDSAVEKEIKIFLNCRLIRDYQQVITLNSICRFPQIKISDFNIYFKGILISKDSSNEKDISALDDSSQKSKDSTTISKDRGELKKSSEPNINQQSIINSTQQPQGTSKDSKKKVEIEFNESQLESKVIVSNNYDKELTYFFKGYTMFFIIETENNSNPDDCTVLKDKTCTSTITIKPNIPVIMEHSNLLIKEKYLEEHIIIYNKSRTSEKYVVSLRITIGQLTAFSASSGLKGGYHYRNLEYLITKFLRKFKKFWFNIGSQQKETSNSPSLPPKNLLVSTSTLLDNSWTNIISGSTKSTFDELNDLEKLKDLIESNEKYQTILFNLQHLTNELILFGLKKQVGALTSQLATLFYCGLIKQGLIKVLFKLNMSKPPLILTVCINSLDEFLSYFPEKRDDLVDLRNLQNDINLKMNKN